MTEVTICSDFGAPQNTVSTDTDTVSTVSPSISYEVMGPDAMIFVFWMLSFKPTFSLSSFTFIKRLFSSSSFSAIRVVLSAYLRLLIFLPAILIPAYASSSPAFIMMYSAYKLNKQGDNIQPWCTSFPIWNQSVVPRPVLTVASWPAYRFLKRQVRQRIKKQRHYFANKGPSSQGYGFSSILVRIWELDYKEGSVPKNWCFWTVLWRRLLRVPWTARRTNQSILKEISPGIFFGRNDAEAETPVLWPPHAKSWLIGKDWC